MPQKYTKEIELFCEERGIQIPTGFYRHPASRYVAVNQSASPPKLVAKTWFNSTDMVYYLKNVVEHEATLKLLDFKERTELRYEGGARLSKGAAF